MKLLRWLVMLFLFLSIFSVAKAQNASSFSIQEWERAKSYTKAFLEAMPDKDYSLKPTPQMRSFADQMLHLAADNYVFSANAIGIKVQEEKSLLEQNSLKTKNVVIANVMDSYDFAIASFKTLNEKTANEKVLLFSRHQLSRIQIFEKGFEHQTHHRGQTTVYLRLAGITPPEEKLF